MTPQSLLHFLEALSWATLIFLANTGLGALVLKLWRLRGASLPLAAVTGVGLIIFLGGCLNLLHAISHPAELVLIVIGVIAFLVIRPPWEPSSSNETHTSQPSPWTRPVLLLAALVFLI